MFNEKNLLSELSSPSPLFLLFLMNDDEENLKTTPSLPFILSSSLPHRSYHSVSCKFHFSSLHNTSITHSLAFFVSPTTQQYHQQRTSNISAPSTIWERQQRSSNNRSSNNATATSAIAVVQHHNDASPLCRTNYNNTTSMPHHRWHESFWSTTESSFFEIVYTDEHPDFIYIPGAPLWVIQSSLIIS